MIFWTNYFYRVCSIEPIVFSSSTRNIWPQYLKNVFARRRDKRGIDRGNRQWQGFTSWSRCRGGGRWVLVEVTEGGLREIHNESWDMRETDVERMEHIQSNRIIWFGFSMDWFLQFGKLTIQSKINLNLWLIQL